MYVLQKWSIEKINDSDVPEPKLKSNWDIVFDLIRSRDISYVDVRNDQITFFFKDPASHVVTCNPHIVHDMLASIKSRESDISMIQVRENHVNVAIK